MVLLLCNISVPPNHNTMTMSIVPRNSLIGCAICWRMLTRLMVLRYRLLDSVKRVFIFFSALKALMMRRPPSVSSSCDIKSLHCPWAMSEPRFSFFPTVPITQPMMGTMAMVNKVSCQLIIISVVK